MVMSTEAGGPAAMTRSIRSGTSTWRPAESTTSLPAVAGKKARVASMPAHASRIEAALSLLAGNALRKSRADRLARRASGAQRASLPEQPAHGPKFLFGRGLCDLLDGTIELNDPLAACRQSGAPALATTDCRSDRWLVQGLVDLID
jgi:hypothetical protein